MTALQLFWHVLNFVAPSAFLALGLLVFLKLLSKKRKPSLSYKAMFAIVFALSLALQVGALLLLGRDGKLLTYALMALGGGACMFVFSRGWK